MASYMEPERLENFLVHILIPVYRIAEDDTIRDPQMGECCDDGYGLDTHFLFKMN
jgi:hypothetical protein